jgi:phosphoribosylglycinamide formyltransferase-1
MPPKKIAIFISGRGSNLQAILTEVKRGKINAHINIVISDNSEAHGLSYARENGIECSVFTKVKNESRSDYFKKIMSFLEPRKIDLIVLAGFMKVLSPNIIHRYKNRMINIHPALLPSFPGVHAQKQAVDYGVKYSGCSVHFIDEGVDTGPIILQEVVPVYKEDNEESLSTRILEREHLAFPLAVKLFCDDRLIIKGRQVYIKKSNEKEKKNDTS